MLATKPPNFAFAGSCTLSEYFPSSSVLSQVSVPKPAGGSAPAKTPIIATCWPWFTVLPPLGSYFYHWTTTTILMWIAADWLSTYSAEYSRNWLLSLSISSVVQWCVQLCLDCSSFHIIQRLFQLLFRPHLQLLMSFLLWAAEHIPRRLHIKQQLTRSR